MALNLRKLLAPEPVQGELTPDPNQPMMLFGLQQRMRAAIDQRNAARRTQGVPEYALEREDPNMGTMSLLAQAIDEKGGRMRRPSDLIRNRMFEKDALMSDHFGKP